jgi:hypothetical protein
LPHFSQTRLYLMRPPSSGCTWRKLMSFSSVAEKSFTGIVTRPKEIAPFHIERGMPLVCLMLLTVAPSERSRGAVLRVVSQHRREKNRSASARRGRLAAQASKRSDSKASSHSERSERSNQARIARRHSEEKASGGVLPPRATTTAAAAKARSARSERSN